MRSIMKNMKKSAYIIFALLLMATFVSGCTPKKQASDKITNIIHDKLTDKVNKNNIKNKLGGKLKVHFIDVGQGDGILIKSPAGKTMLIDAGDNNQEKPIVQYIKDQGITRIDYVIGTHPHADHIGGLDAVIKNFDIGEIYMPKKSATTKTFESVLREVKAKGLKVKTAKAGIKIDLGKNAKAVMVAPNSAKYEDTNNYSAVVKLTYGDTSFLLTGDAEGISEKEMLEKKQDLAADVLKAGHHGSRTSTTDAFLKAVNPKYVVISCKKENKYGHPHKEIIEKLKRAKIPVYITKDKGNIIAVSDGKDIDFQTQRK